MRTIKIPYGKTHLTAEIPESRLAAVLTSDVHSKQECVKCDQQHIVLQALENPIGSATLAELAKNKRKIVIITSDHTRPVPSSITAPLLVQEIKRGNGDAEIIFLVATGFHRSSTREELVGKFGGGFVDSVRIVMHDCRDNFSMANFGTLPSGGSLVLHRLVAEADLLIAEGFIEPHFFAGFSGGRKSVLPGVASKVTVLANHNAAFIAHPRARAGVLKGNPLHEDMRYAADKAGLAFILNVVLDADKKIVKAFAGQHKRAHEAGCRFVLGRASVKASPADIVITSNGGYPLDQNIYQAVKGMAAAEATVRTGGVIIMCAACNDGHGGEAFCRWFADNPGGAKQVMEKIMLIKPQDTLPDQWEAQILARILLKARVIVVTDQCDHQLIENMHMQAALSLPEALRIAESMVGGAAKITVIPDGVSVVVTP